MVFVENKMICVGTTPESMFVQYQT